MDFAFIFDSRLRRIVERDYAELQTLDPYAATKSVITLSGSIIEALLFDALVASGKWSFEEASAKRLKDMITVAHAIGIITEDRLTNATRNSRNLIHPGREIRDKTIFDQTDAQAAKVAVDITTREVRTWAASENQKRKLTRLLGKLTPDQVEFLQLFSLPKPPVVDQYEHPFLRNEVYRSCWNLIDNGILTKEHAKDLSESEEGIRLVPEAIELVEKLVIKGKIQRDSIILHHGNIGASGAGGGGAPAHSYSMRR